MPFGGLPFVLLLAACLALAACFPSSRKTPKEDHEGPPNVILILSPTT